MRKVYLILMLIGLLSSCGKDNPLTIVYPKEYLPAYPGSYWDYSNGERVTVQPEYVAHNYQASINSPDYTEEKMVPCINGDYLYEYSITQFSTTYPLKTLLQDKPGKAWIVNEVNGEIIYRQTIALLDSIYIYEPSFGIQTDSLYKDVLVVVEYSDTLTAKKWNLKEYYAKNVGLIRVDVNDPFYSKDSVTQKVIIGYHINK
jgi:hypothetical protein